MQSATGFFLSIALAQPPSGPGAAAQEGAGDSKPTADVGAEADAAGAASPAAERAKEAAEAGRGRLRAAAFWVHERPDDPEARAHLREVLRQIEANAPVVASSESLQNERRTSLLRLAAAQLSMGEKDAAAEVIDELIRLDRGRSAPSDQMGPSLRSLYQERLDAFEREGLGRLVLECEGCQLYVNEQKASSPMELPPGKYRVWMDGPSGHWQTTAAVVAGEDSVVPYPAQELARRLEGPRAPGVDLATQADRGTQKKRLLPLWVEVLAIGLGSAAVAGGSTLLVFDGAHPTGDISQGYENIGPGVGLIAGGVALLGTGAVLLGLDQRRRR